MMLPFPLPAVDGAALRRALAPHWGALLAAVLFLVAGLSILDDYGVTIDESRQREITAQNLAYIRGEHGVLPSNHDKFYGVVFEMPLLFAENLLGVEHLRGIHLLRHLLTHLVFLSGGIFAYLISYRLFGNRLIALSAMLFFLLHPRLYGHSFYNSKDIPFVVIFIVAIHLTYNAIRGKSILAFVALGAAVGALVNIRLMGLVLPGCVIAMQSFDFARSANWAERKRVLATAGAFALAGALTTYALTPYLWADPLERFVEWWDVSSNHPANPYEIFRGTIYRSKDFPSEYLPVWFSITAPPFALLLGLAGTVAILWRGIRSIGQASRSVAMRVAMLLVCCFILPVLWVVLTGPNIYTGWRQMYFLWAPFALLAAYGMKRLVEALGQPRLRAAASGAATVGLAATLVSMALIHPNQQAFFNFSVDRVTPEHLRTQYTMDYWSHFLRQTWERLLEAHPDAPVGLNGKEYYFGTHMLGVNRNILPEALKRKTSTDIDPDALAFAQWYANKTRVDRAVHRVTMYNNTMASLSEKIDLNTVYEDILSNPTRAEWRISRNEDGSVDYALNRSGMHIRVSDGSLVYVRDACPQTEIMASRFRVQSIPENMDDLPELWRFYGVEIIDDLHFPGHGARIGDKCVAAFPLPKHPIGEFRANEYIPQIGDIWVAEFTTNIAFDLSLSDGAMTYVKEPCVEADTEPRFRLHITPERVSDLPEERRRYGFDNLDFTFADRGVSFNGKCTAVIELPGYPIIGIAAGQYIEIEGGWEDIWTAEFQGPRPERLPSA